MEPPVRKTLLAVPAVAAIALAALSAPPAEAQTVTFTLTGSSLAISEPSSTAALTSGALSGLTGSAVTGALGSTVVTDQRGGVAGWSSKIAGDANGFSNGTTTIPASSAVAWVPVGSLTSSGVAVVTAGTHVTQATGLALTTSAQNLVTATAVVGNNSATFTPSLAVSIPSNATAGDYSGVVTQTVG
jgi:hypothetical protein